MVVFVLFNCVALYRCSFMVVFFCWLYGLMVFFVVVLQLLYGGGFKVA